MNFEIILACDTQYGIGQILWHISDDLKFFRNKTLNCVVIMGRKTADTFNSPLSNRINIVITTHENYRRDDGFYSAKTLDCALIYAKKLCKKIFIIGGAQLVEYAVQNKYCRGIYINYIDYNYKCDIKLTDKCIEYIKKTYVQQIMNIKGLHCKKINKLVNVKFIYYTYINHEEMQYLKLLDKILKEGELCNTRNGTTYSIFGEKLVFDLTNGFPLLTTKKMFSRGIFEELLFFLKGCTNTKLLEDKKIMIWHDNTTTAFIEKNNKKLKEYDMGPMYGYQWRHYGGAYPDINSGIDQLSQVIDLLVHDPSSRRILMTTYNPEQVEQGVLYPCHGLQIQFNVSSQKYINLQMYQRSADCILGLPFNIASYALLLHIITNMVNNNIKRKHNIDYIPGRLIIILGDAHIYTDEKSNHINAAYKQLELQTYKFPTLNITKKLITLEDMENMTIDDIYVNDYISGPVIKAYMIA